MSNRPYIALTLGDPSGVGPEILVKGIETIKTFCRPLIIGDLAHLKSQAEPYAPALSWKAVSKNEIQNEESDSIEVFDLKNVPKDLPMGRATKESGQAAVESIRTATELALAQEVDAITTAPINKEAIHLAGHDFPGHTEMLAHLTNTPEVALMLAGESLRVVLATTHVPLTEVASLITPERVLKIVRITHKWLCQTGHAHPKIAVTGLNPHCGEGGIFGDEETRGILPALKTAQEEGIEVTGPFSADALFGRLHKIEVDAVITMFHDQGMIPIKMASMGKAVNITLGLPIIRTSVDHGTAYDIVGTGQAEPESLIEATRVACRLVESSLTPR